ncbi:MAG: glycosyltransferase family 2 protein [Candidatus Omnitrophica bacterium]|nr:glycosyltransferase family 2 protein [Candidatus Omnitrophota bacterium]MBU1870191.1 glycosyltransferase family 2 protein [Candidatus Omnitrophota bacterium]
MEPLVSVIVPTYNSARTLDECLGALKRQEYKNIEIIVTDSFSKDKTKEIAKRYGAKILDAETLALARKMGVELSKGKYILFLDSDQIIEPDTISRSVEACEAGGFDGVTHFERSKIHKNTFVERLINYDKWIFHSEQDDDPIYGTAEPRFFKADLVKKIDFLDNPPITFELAIINLKMNKMGARIKFVDAYIYHYETPTFWHVARKFYRYGFYYIPALKRFPNLVLHHSAPRRSYFSARALTHPFLLLGLFFLYGVKGVATFCGIVASSFMSKC